MLVAITGANGFLAKKIKLDNPSLKFIDITRSIIDYYNPQEVHDFFNTLEFDIVIHTAANANTKECEENEENTNLINVEMTKAIADVCRLRNKKMIFFSSEQCFNGQTNSGPFKENDNLISVTNYGLQKIQAENYIIGNLDNYIILRLSWMMDIDGNSNIISKTLEAINSKKETLFTVNEIRCHTLVRNLSSQFIKIMNLESGVYHFASENNLNTYEAAVYLAKKFGYSDDDINKYLLPDNNRYSDRKRDYRLDSTLIKSKGIVLTTFEDDINNQIRDKEMYPFKLEPIYDKTIWGDDKLLQIRGKKDIKAGTSWEVSAHPYCQNVIKNGIHENTNLMELIKEYPYEMLNDKTLDDVLRLAYLDSKQDLSIQVHPNNEYAKNNANDYGKTEAWYILDASEEATLVAGTKINDVDKIRQSIEDDSIMQYVNKVNVKKGDFIFIEAGLIHALGKNILALEFSTNSNTTYRFYDYNRADDLGNKRKLHIKESFDVTDFNKKPIVTSVTKNETTKLCDNKYFKVEHHYVTKTKEIYNQDSFMCVSFVKNGGVVKYKNTTISCDYTETIFIPYRCRKIEIIGDCEILVSYPSN